MGELANDKELERQKAREKEDVEEQGQKVKDIKFECDSTIGSESEIETKTATQTEGFVYLFSSNQYGTLHPYTPLRNSVTKYYFAFSHITSNVQNSVMFTRNSRYSR